ncbi:MAG: YraN family protein [Pseudomonadota bacterium]
MASRHAKDRRRRAERRGRRAEFAAQLLLRMKGWRILDQRARTGAGEIDIVCRRGATLAFIEVKARADLETARGALSPRQTDRLLRAGALWRARHSRYAALQPRYDLMLVAPWRWPRHLEGVIRAEGRMTALL